MSMMEAVPPAAVAVAALDAVPVAAADLVMAAAVPAAAVRRAALDRWQAAHDPAHLQDPARLAEAAAFAPLLDSEQEPAFDAVLFAELIEFFRADALVNTLVGDLFGTPVVPGFASAPDIITPEEERALIARIDASPLEPFTF